MSEKEESDAKDADGDGNRKPYPLVQACSLPEDMKREVLELVTSTIEKHGSSHTISTQEIKMELDRTYGESWNIVVGEAFGFHVAYLNDNIMYLFYGGDVGVLIWKSA